MRIAFHNLGCKVNAYETEAMMRQFEQMGHVLVPFEEKADIYIVNTCTVTNIADRKSRQMLHRARKQNPDALVVAVGCYVQTASEKILADSGVDVAIGTAGKSEAAEKILQAAREKQAGTLQQRILTDTKIPDRYENMQMTETMEHSRAFVKVEDGCNQFCSYCVIPYARGRVRSREMADVLNEVRELACHGIREVVLTGIHLSSYGVDFVPEEKRNPEVPFDGDPGLSDLIQAVSEISGIERIRLGSLEPRIVTESFAEALSRNEKICPHFHLSLQSGCDATLKRMNRHYTTAEYEKSCQLLRKYFDQPAITTDVIAGFPQETEEEFEETKKFLTGIRFYEMHVFPFSRREGTRADKMDGQIPDQEKKRRSGELLALSKKMSEEYIAKKLGTCSELLTEETTVIDGICYTAGYTREYIRALVPGNISQNTILHGVLTEKENLPMPLFIPDAT